MTLTYKQGDLFQSQYDAYGHGTNTLGIMGAGIAVVFKKQNPTMYKEYSLVCRLGQMKPGHIFPWESTRGPWIYNLMTQGNVKNLILGATTKAIYESVSRMLVHAKEHNVHTIGLPKIGAGLGGLCWEEVEKELLFALEYNNSDISLIVHTL